MLFFGSSSPLLSFTLIYVCLALLVQNFLVFVFLHKIAEFIT